MQADASYWNQLDYDTLESNVDTNKCIIVTPDESNINKEIERLGLESERYRRLLRVQHLKGGKKNQDSQKIQDLAIKSDSSAIILKEFVLAMNSRIKAKAAQKKGCFQESQQEWSIVAYSLDIVKHTLSQIRECSENNCEEQMLKSHEHSCTHSRTCNHGHTHDMNERSPKETTDKFSQMVDSCLLEALVRAGQCALSLSDYTTAVDILRKAVLHDEQCFIAWVLRAEAYLSMGCPLLAQVHLDQPAVDHSLAIVKTLQTSVDEELAITQSMQLEALVQREFDRRLGNKNIDVLSVLETLTSEADRLRLEKFHYSATIKYMTCLKELDQATTSEAHRLRVSCLTGLAACYIGRDTGNDLAIGYCTSALRVPVYGCDNPKALYYRAQAHAQNYQFSFAIEDLQRAHDACILLQSSKQSETWTSRQRLDEMPFVEFRDVQEASHEDQLENLLQQIRGRLDAIEYSRDLLGEVTNNLSVLPTLARTGGELEEWQAATRSPFMYESLPNKRYQYEETPQSVGIIILPHSTSTKHLELFKRANRMEDSVMFPYHFAPSFDRKFVENAIFTGSAPADRRDTITEYEDLGYITVTKRKISTEDTDAVIHGVITELSSSTTMKHFYMNLSFDNTLPEHDFELIVNMITRIDSLYSRNVLWILTSDTPSSDASIPLTMSSNVFRGWTSNDDRNALNETRSRPGIEEVVVNKEVSLDNVITGCFDLYPTVFHLATCNVSKKHNCVGRDLSGNFTYKFSSRYYAEHGNYALYTKDGQRYQKIITSQGIDGILVPVIQEYNTN